MATRQELDQFLCGVERKAYRIAAAATGHPDEAFDIVQDAMMKLAQKYSDKTPADWGPLFNRILQSRIMDWHRRTSVRNKFKGWLSLSGDKNGEDKNAENDPIQQAEDLSGRSPEQIVQTDGAMDRLSNAVTRLPIRQRQAFMLRVWEGLNVAETATAMSVTEGSVKTHYSRAVASLREQLEGYWP